MVLEGRDRIGGRAFTDTATFQRPWDHGCHWLQTPEENPFTRLADEHGFVVAPAAAPGGIHVDGARLRPRDEQAAVEFRERAFAAIRRAGGAGADLPASELIDWTHPAAAYAAHAFAARMGIEPRQASSLDFANYRWIGEDRPVRDGFGALVHRVFAGVPVTLRARVRRIDLTGPRPCVTSEAGECEASQVLVTVSTGVLRSEAIAFTPRLPEMMRQGREAMDVEIWPPGWDGVTCYLDGDLARRLEEAGGRAGEAIPLSWAGDVHGAYQSGLDAAEAMLIGP